MTQEKTPLHKWIMLAAAVLLVALTKLLLPPAGLGEAGFQILGILAAAIILFLSWGTGWTSMAIVFAMLTLPGVSSAQVTQATFGNNTVVFLLFCFMLAACLTESGAARRIAIWFLTNRLARKSPWWTVAMYFASVYVLDFFLSAFSVQQPDASCFGYLVKRTIRIAFEHFYRSLHFERIAYVIRQRLIHIRNQCADFPACLFARIDHKTRKLFRALEIMHERAFAAFYVKHNVARSCGELFAHYRRCD